MITLVDVLAMFSRVLDVIWDKYAPHRIDQILDEEVKGSEVCFDVMCYGSILSSNMSNVALLSLPNK